MEYNQRLFSIITPCYNCAAFLGQAVESVLSQNFTDWEMIIIDDCSTDTSWEIACGFAELDSRIKVWRMKQNSGAAACRNFALELAQGRYVAILDADDIWLPEKLKIQMESFLNGAPAVVYSYYEKMDENGRRAGRVVRSKVVSGYKDLLCTNQIGNLTSAFDRVQTGDLKYPIIPKLEDYAFWLAIAKRGLRFKLIPQVLAFYRIRSSSLSANKLWQAFAQWSLYRRIEGLGLWASIYYFISYGVNGLLKTLR